MKISSWIICSIVVAYIAGTAEAVWNLEGASGKRGVLKKRLKKLPSTKRLCSKQLTLEECMAELQDSKIYERHPFRFLRPKERLDD
ncbi:hypothetical protein AC249_AIPGENE3094 [Exaiptasia diaphana]|nr:hypothetical protein AC249_AIPGENE3094 [Exaiptasia diaphana]